MKKFIVFLVIALTGCADSYTQRLQQQAQQQEQQRRAKQAQLDEIIATSGRTADFGIYPKNYQDIVKAYFAQRLKDPESARYTNFRAPAKDVQSDVSTMQITYGYSTCVDINAKNSYGGYVGARQYWLFIRNGQIIDVHDPDVFSIGFLRAKQVDMIADECRYLRVW